MTPEQKQEQMRAEFEKTVSDDSRLYRIDNMQFGDYNNDCTAAKFEGFTVATALIDAAIANGRAGIDRPEAGSWLESYWVMGADIEKNALDAGRYNHVRTGLYGCYAGIYGKNFNIIHLDEEALDYEIDKSMKENGIPSVHSSEQRVLDKLECGHHGSLLVRSVESDYQFCELCECMSMRNDAEMREAELLSERDTLIEKLRKLKK